MGVVGTPRRRPLTFVRTESGCYECVSHKSKGSKGRPMFSFDRRSRHTTLYRYVYECLKGPIPKGKQIDHLCKNKRCCEVSHMEVVTGAVNVRRHYGHTDDGICKKHGGPMVRRTDNGGLTCLGCRKEWNSKKVIGGI